MASTTAAPAASPPSTVASASPRRRRRRGGKGRKKSNTTQAPQPPATPPLSPAPTPAVVAPPSQPTKKLGYWQSRRALSKASKSSKGTKSSKATKSSKPSTKSQSPRASDPPNQPTPLSRSQDPIHLFFARYPTFPYNPHTTYTHEFARLREHQQWPTDDELANRSPFKSAAERAREQAYRAVEDEFETLQIASFEREFGTDVRCVESWKKLAAAAGVGEGVEDIETLRKIIKNTFVNMVDLHQFVMEKNLFPDEPEPETPNLFNDVYELRDYSLKTGRIFPKEKAKESGTLLKKLLRRLIRPRKDKIRFIPASK